MALVGARTVDVVTTKRATPEPEPDLTLAAKAARVRIGTAGWSLPATVRERFAPGASQLERYAGTFTCVEINSSFYRPHRRSTYERWASSVPNDFAFALKLPRSITHERRLAACNDDIDRFLDESSGLGEKRAILLVQLPPSFAFEGTVAGSFFESMRARDVGLIACEPRHPSWFSPEAEALLSSFEIARVAADPALVEAAAAPGGWRGLAYYRWHGAPRTYYSAYGETALRALAARVATERCFVWCVFDNTASGAATENALRLAAFM